MKNGRRSSSGFTLLEVLLSLAILGGAIAVLGELARHGILSAKAARDITQAQLLCESKMSEITVGVLSPDAVLDVPFDEIVGDGSIVWQYSIESELIDQEGLLSVRVTVSQDLEPEKDPISFSLNRWILDPDVGSESDDTSESGGAL